MDLPVPEFWKWWSQPGHIFRRSLLILLDCLLCGFRLLGRCIATPGSFTYYSGYAWTQRLPTQLEKQGIAGFNMHA